MSVGSSSVVREVSSYKAKIHHLDVLREMLSRNHVQRGDSQSALAHLAGMALEGVDADVAFVALFDAKSYEWSAVDSHGARLDSRAISQQSSLTLLNKIRLGQQSMLARADGELGVTPESIRPANDPRVLVAPLFFWDVGTHSPTRYFGGCLYVHRRSGKRPFTEDEVALILDVTKLAEPSLDLLRYVNRLEADLDHQCAVVDELRVVARQERRLGDLRTRDPEFALNVIERLRRICQAQKVGLLLLGPTGSGKSHVAQAFHYECARRGGPFVTLDCSQVTSATTLAAELFGYAPNSGYVNAPIRGRAGKAELAHKGTLFIDEVSVLPAELQPKLLRLIHDGSYAPLGSSRERTVDIQVVAATNANLGELARSGAFREDLYWRLCEFVVKIPSLDERVVDIPDLALGLLERERARLGRENIVGFTEDALRALLRHDWSNNGNIRGLQHEITRALLLAGSDATRIDRQDLLFETPFVESSPTNAGPDELAPRPAPDRVGSEGQTGGDRARLRRLLEQKLESYHADITKLSSDPDVCRVLGRGGRVSRSTVYQWLSRLGLTSSVAAIREQRRRTRYREVVEAIREFGTGSEAAAALGISRHALVARLRAFGSSIGDVLGKDGRPSVHMTGRSRRAP